MRARVVVLVLLAGWIAFPGPLQAGGADDKPPVCLSYTIASPPKRVKTMVGDGRSGLASITVTKSENADTIVPPFSVGTNDPVIVSSTKIDQTKGAKVVMQVADLDGEKRTCRKEF